MRRAATSPNDQVRAARLRHPSTLAPGEPLSRQELAERVNRWIYEQDQTITEIDANYIGKLERGVIRWPQCRYREALRAILRVETDRDLGFHRPAQSANGGVEVDRQQFLRAAAVASVTTALPASPTPHHASRPAAVARPTALDSLRAVVTSPAAWVHAHEPTPAGLAALRNAAQDAHRCYQSADYDAAAALLPGIVTDLDALTMDVPEFASSEAVHGIRSIAYLAAAKLATKLNDQDLAWVCADRAAQSALAANMPALAATAHRQVACVFHETGRWDDAYRISLRASEALTRTGDVGPDFLSARGALYLLAAMTASRGGDHAEAQRMLASAATDAGRLGCNDNRLWSAFGPTNVALHTLAVSIAFDQPTDAVEIGNRIDTAALPPSLVGRRAQVHVDIADAHTRLRNDTTATVHIQEIERIAPQILRVNGQARDIIATMLRRARGSTFPVLRGIADRADIAA